jgi:hypothetical protein
MATEITHGSVKKITFSWTADSSGDASETTSATFDGKLLHVVTVPDGDSAPTADYDVTLTDSDGVDLLEGNGANRAAASTEHIASASLGAVAHSALTLTVANAGDGGAGVLHVYIR